MKALFSNDFPRHAIRDPPRTPPLSRHQRVAIALVASPLPTRLKNAALQGGTGAVYARCSSSVGQGAIGSAAWAACFIALQYGRTPLRGSADKRDTVRLHGLVDP